MLSEKNLFLGFLVLIYFLGFQKLSSQNKKLSKEQLEFFKENYDWSSEKFFIINYRQPKLSCHYDNYKNMYKSRSEWKKYYSKITLENTLNIFVYSDKKRAEKIIDSKKHFSDKNYFLYLNFFSKEKTCYAVLIANSKGEYQQKNGEYSQKDIIKMIDQLK